ncbi:MAG: VanZ family protein [Ferruginibacter sp.]
MSFLLLKPILLMFILVYSGLILYRFIAGYGRLKQPKSFQLKSELVIVLFVFYIATVLALTILPVSVSHFQNPKEPGVNFIPLINTYRYLTGKLLSPHHIVASFFTENIIGNLVLFIPLGIFLPIIFPGLRSFKKIVFISFISSFSIEMIQLILREFGTYRMADIDDIILNSVGGMIGYFLYKKLAPMRRATPFAT